jgi:ABC-2 type transport system permease protein
MNRSVVGALILKDWRLQRNPLLVSGVAGVLSLGMFYFKREVPAVLGAVWFFVAMIVLACILPVTNVISERKNHHLAFMMSLPLSASQYTMSKVVSTFGLFLLLWLTLVASALLLIVIGGVIPHGMIPLTLVLSGMVLAGFCLIAAAAIVGESEGWSSLATIVCNSSYGVGNYLIMRIPAVQHEMGSPVAVWSPFMLTFLGAEFAFIALTLGVTFFAQSRKRDFV